MFIKAVFRLGDSQSLSNVFLSPLFPYLYFLMKTYMSPCQNYVNLASSLHINIPAATTLSTIAVPKFVLFERNRHNRLIIIVNLQYFTWGIKGRQTTLCLFYCRKVELFSVCLVHLCSGKGSWFCSSDYDCQPHPSQRPKKSELSGWQLSTRKNFPDEVRKSFSRQKSA